MPDTMIDGVQIHYNETGEGEPLLLIMGYGMPGDAWLGSLPFLNGFHSIYYDNRGTGRSDKPAGRSPRRSRRRAGGAQDHAGAILRCGGRTRDAGQEVLRITREQSCVGGAGRGTPKAGQFT